MQPFIFLTVDGRGEGRFDLPSNFVGKKGNYVIDQHEDGGGNGAVFSASVRGSGAKVAIKLQRILSPVRRARFDNEIRIQSELRHPGVAELLDSGIVKLGPFDVPWSVIELGGANLRDHVERLGPVEPGRIKEMATEMASALEHLHSKDIIHRDLKPANFVWKLNGYGVLMIDFGIAKHVGEDVDGRYFKDLTGSNEFIGAQNFYSQELLAYASDKSTLVDQRSDLFQLGKVIWFCATGHVSMGTPDADDCPLNGRLHAIVSQCLLDKREKRPQSAKRLHEMLQKL